MDFVLPVIIFGFSAGITPGPNNIMIMSSGLNFGIRRSLQHFLGICIGFPLMFILLGLGLGALFVQNSLFHATIQALGVCYLLYLAWKIATAAPMTLKASEARPLSFLQAVLFQWINPKAWAIATGTISAFTSVEVNVFLQIVVMTGLFFIISMINTSAWLFFGKSLRRVLKTAQHQKVFNISMASLLVMSFSPIAYDLITAYLF